MMIDVFLSCSFLCPVVVRIICLVSMPFFEHWNFSCCYSIEQLSKNDSSPKLFLFLFPNPHPTRSILASRSVNCYSRYKKSFCWVLFGLNSVFFCSELVLSIEGASRGYRGPFEGVSRALALRTPSNPPLKALQTPFIHRMNLNWIKKQKRTRKWWIES